MVHGRRVERPPNWPVPHAVAFRLMLAAHVLDDPDVSFLDDHTAWSDRLSTRSRWELGV